jgi:hypothetical protein
MVFYFPKLPQFVLSISESPVCWSLRLVACVYEAYLALLGFGIILCANYVSAIALVGMGSTIDAQIQNLKRARHSCEVGIDDDETVAYKCNQFYQSITLVMERLNTVFSLSWFFQETSFLLVIVLFFLGAQWAIELKSILLQVYIISVPSALLVLLVFQFYPMVLPNLYSKSQMKLNASLMMGDVRGRQLSRRSRELKIRPMGVHTITISTFSDYAVFLVSIFLMLSKA